jgi:hypothetical protein
MKIEISELNSKLCKHCLFRYRHLKLEIESDLINGKICTVFNVVKNNETFFFNKLEDAVKKFNQELKELDQTI